jgi:hypothetical protein
MDTPPQSLRGQFASAKITSLWLCGPHRWGSRSAIALSQSGSVSTIASNTTWAIAREPRAHQCFGGKPSTLRSIFGGPASHFNNLRFEFSIAFVEGTTPTAVGTGTHACRRPAPEITTRRSLPTTFWRRLDLSPTPALLQAARGRPCCALTPFVADSDSPTIIRARRRLDRHRQKNPELAERVGVDDDHVAFARDGPSSPSPPRRRPIRLPQSSRHAGSSGATRRRAGPPGKAQSSAVAPTSELNPRRQCNCRASLFRS